MGHLIINYLVGVVFGRWLLDEKRLNYDKIDIFASLPGGDKTIKSLGQTVDETQVIIEEKLLLKKITNYLKNLFYNENDINDRICRLIGTESLQNYLSSPFGFFAFHFKYFSKNRRYAPIYWPLQIASGSFTLWVYYHNLNTQTLYSCINNFVEPRLLILTEELNLLKNKGKNRSSKEEKALTNFLSFETELKNFKDELSHLAKLWKPNLNDGVQITAAPLWKLFQHKAWQKKLKKTWEELEKGKYDWSHMAYNIWPERVLNKCHQDRSIAIAHDVESELWEKVEISDKRGKGTKMEWRPKEMSDSELNTYIQKKIANKD